MSVNTIRPLSEVTYNGNSIKVPEENHLNIFMGIGVWSSGDGLSQGLPIDVMQMLLSATIMRSQIIEANPGKSSKVIILLADSMATREGAGIEDVARLIHIYKRSLEPLLELLNIKESSEIILSSELEGQTEYDEVVASVESSHTIQRLKEESPLHYAYVRTQTAITRYMERHRDAGIKVGWIYEESSREVNGRTRAEVLKRWDELKFDRWCEEILEDSSMQYLYTKSGLKQPKHGKNVAVREGCPYTAYEQDNRYILQTESPKDIKDTLSLQKSVKDRWIGVARVCSYLIQERLVDCRLLPDDCIRRNNQIATIYNMLNYWVNFPILASEAVCAVLASGSLRGSYA